MEHHEATMRAQEIIDLDYADELDTVANFIADRRANHVTMAVGSMKEWEYKLRDEARDMRDDVERRRQER